MRTYKARRKQGLCTACGKQTSGNTRCKKCIKKEKQRYRQKKKSGICSSCNSKTTPGMVKCAKCRGKNSTLKRINRRKSNYCRWCDSFKCNRDVMCYLKRVVQRHFVGVKINETANALKEIFDRQGGRCAYTGRQMTIGGNASLDHIIPKARGGKNTIDNVQWVILECNKLKSVFLEDQFLTLVKDIYKHRIDNR